MTTEKSIQQLEKENKELRQLLDKAVKAFAILQDVAKEYEKMTSIKDSKVSDDGTGVKKLLEKYSRL